MTQQLTRRHLLQGVAGSAATGLAAEVSSRTPRRVRKPHVVIILFDDVGFADLGCYGSEIATPAVDALAAGGVRFNNFHTTALCAPTRACLLTGINAHATGMGNIPEWSSGAPGYRGVVDLGIPLLPRMLQSAGYRTFAVGKWHLQGEADAYDSFDHWPTRRGFDRWYGFQSSAADQWYPELYDGTADAPRVFDDGYHLTDDLIARSLTYIDESLTATPADPTFLYVGLGACHFPYHAPKSFIDAYRGRYADGWMALRQARFARQRAMGIIPADTILPEGDGDLPDWSKLSVVDRDLSARFQEAYSGFMSHTDAAIGRLVEGYRQRGLLDDTIFIVTSDNGAGLGSARIGQVDVRRQSYAPETAASIARSRNEIGGWRSWARYAPGWAQAGNTPFRYYKGNTYGGGTTAPLIVHWPKGRLAAGKVATGYTHAIDLVPTLAALTRSEARFATAPRSATAPQTEGDSFAPLLRQPRAKSAKRQQIFEMLGDRAVWYDGWRAVVRHRRGKGFSDDDWALYDLDRDFAEANDVAAAHPERLRDLQQIWAREAERQNVLPLSDSTETLFRAQLPKPLGLYAFALGMPRLGRLKTPDLLSNGFRFEAVLDVGEDTNGVILACGDSAAGYEWFVESGRICFTYVFVRETVLRVEGPVLAPGTRRLAVEIAPPGAARHVTLIIDDRRVASAKMPGFWPVQALNAGLRCGHKDGPPVSARYRGWNAMTGKLSDVRAVRLPAQ